MSGHGKLTFVEGLLVLCIRTWFCERSPLVCLATCWLQPFCEQVARLRHSSNLATCHFADFPWLVYQEPRMRLLVSLFCDHSAALTSRPWRD